ncbi:MAG: hypothetical protein LBI42_04645 [Chitinispirillales bacterium]|jgi:hypothetical protein|nr:hypothetical protein [Chitinispirillales bacterium]
MTKAEREACEKFLMDKQNIDSAIRTAEMKGKAEGAKKLAELIEKGIPLPEAMKMLGID